MPRDRRDRVLAIAQHCSIPVHRLNFKKWTAGLARAYTVSRRTKTKKKVAVGTSWDSVRDGEHQQIVTKLGLSRRNVVVRAYVPSNVQNRRRVPYLVIHEKTVHPVSFNRTILGVSVYFVKIV